MENYIHSSEESDWLFDTQSQISLVISGARVHILPVPRRPLRQLLQQECYKEKQVHIVIPYTNALEVTEILGLPAPSVVRIHVAFRSLDLRMRLAFVPMVTV